MMRHYLIAAPLLLVFGLFGVVRGQEGFDPVYGQEEDFADNFDPSVAATFASQVRQPPGLSTRPTSTTRSQASTSNLSSYVRLARAPNMQDHCQETL